MYRVEHSIHSTSQNANDEQIYRTIKANNAKNVFLRNIIFYPKNFMVISAQEFF
jgi:hypothetical protein